MRAPYKYEVIRNEDRASQGEIVYECMMCDYGCASDDTRYTGVEHVSVSRNPDGSYPFVTIPVRSLRRIEE